MSGQISVITGATRGIGKAIAFKLAAQGHMTVLFGRNISALDETASEIKNNGGNAVVFSGDVADAHFVNSSIEQVIKKFGRIDNLINNAGVAVFKKFIDTDLSELQLQMQTNMVGVFNFTKAVINNMIENENGAIINISSLAGKSGFVGGSTYAATKHAVMGFTRSLLLEIRKHNIKVCAVCPGSVSTDMIANSQLHPKDFNKVLQPQDVAEVVNTIINLPIHATVSEIEIRPTNP